MAGHSKWANIKRKKAVVDAKRGKLFTKLLREVQAASRLGGPNPDGNSRLKQAILSARAMSVPNDNIERAIKRGGGDGDNTSFEEIVYEGYGPAGVAVIVRALTDNKNRTASDVRHAFTRYNGNLGSSNSVAFQFSEKGQVYVPKAKLSEESVMEIALEAGAQDINDNGDEWEVVTDSKDFIKVKEELEKQTGTLEGEVRMVPQTTVKVTGEDASSVLKLMEVLDDLDDVQKVFANFEIDESEMETLGA